MGKYRSLSGTAIAAIVIVVVIVIIAAGVGAYYATRKHITTTSTTPVATTTSSVPVTSTTTTTTPPPTTSTTTTTTTTTTTHTPVTITVADSYSTSENAAFNQTIAAFEQQYPWIHVNVEYGAQDSASNYQSEVQAGDAPNVLRVSSDSAGVAFASGWLLNLSQYLPKSYFARYINVTIQDSMLNGSVYGLPDDENSIVMFYNKKFVPEPPNTTNQLIQIAENVNKTYHIWGIAYGASDEYGYRFAAWFAGYGGQIFTTINGKIYPDLNSTAMVNALNFWYNLTYNLKINYLAPSPGAGGAEGELFTSNQTAIIFDGPWDLGNYFSALGCNLGAAPLPVVSQTGLYATPFVGAQDWVITTPSASGATPAQINASLLFIEFVTNYSAEMRLWNIAGDIPALTSAYNTALKELSETNTTNTTILCLNNIKKGILEQETHGMIMPNIPQMGSYWSSFHQYASEFFASKINATQAAQGMEQAFIQALQQSGLLSPIPLPNSLYLLQEFSTKY
ncbi:extracellular solute-binding protein [Caldisphaera sp.]|uniref:extracellular solute-binding protein n=1 Tax=Caldisphaera sp. TaxID=2060322 RepID=UPI0025C5F825|nr:extracellular solute-binding protein [Caldisphaera sp.]